MSKENIIRLKFGLLLLSVILLVSCAEECKFDTIVTETLPDGSVGIEYYKRIEIETSCSAPYRKFEKIGGELPEGLTLETTGELKGTPIKAGVDTFKINIRVCFGSNGFEYVDCVDKTKEYVLRIN